ncbi:MAG TPA: hypothetical protein VMV46_19520 [Thermoanaerobaculia bacterium]|nr:hypothetical protein [Thermoanaerobaculia bacterium]
MAKLAESGAGLASTLSCAGFLLASSLGVGACAADPAKRWRDLTIPRAARVLSRSDLVVERQRAVASWRVATPGSWPGYRDWAVTRLTEEGFEILDSESHRVQLRKALRGDLVLLELCPVRRLAAEVEVEVQMVGIPW